MYEIKVLSNQDFDNLPRSITRGSDISLSLGFADPRTGRAYVRYTGIPELEKYLINHELEELESEMSDHEDENGIRHSGLFGGGGGKPKMPSFSAAPSFGSAPKPRSTTQPRPPDAPPIASSSPMNAFGTAESSGAPTGGSVAGRLGTGTLNPSEGLSPDLKDRVKGFYSGRLGF
jgi:hypothetical protein